MLKTRAIVLGSERLLRTAKTGLGGGGREAVNNRSNITGGDIKADNNSRNRAGGAREAVKTGATILEGS